MPLRCSHIVVRASNRLVSLPRRRCGRLLLVGCASLSLVHATPQIVRSCIYTLEALLQLTTPSKVLRFRQSQRQRGRAAIPFDNPTHGARRHRPLLARCHIERSTGTPHAPAAPNTRIPIPTWCAGWRRNPASSRVFPARSAVPPAGFVPDREPIESWLSGSANAVNLRGRRRPPR